MSEKNNYSLEQFCNELNTLISRETEQAALVENTKLLLKKLLPTKEFVYRIMEKFVTDDDFVKKSIITTDRHDLGIYFSPEGNFSMRLFVWLPTVQYPIHDHGAWGIMGGFANKTQEIKYNRLDDGSIEGYARIQEVDRQFITPNETTHVLPLSIHHMSSPNKTSLTLHVYGRPVRKGLMNCFNLADNSSYLVLTPRADKRWYAVQALGTIGGDYSKTLIEKASHDGHPRIRWTSIETMKEVDEDGYKDLLKEALKDSNEEIRKKAKGLLEKI